MRRLPSFCLVIALLATCFLGLADDAAAQRRGGRRAETAPASMGYSEYKPGIDVSASYGWMWGGHIDATINPGGSFESGKFRWASNPSYMFAIEVPMQPGVELQLQYTLQPTELEWDSFSGKRRAADMSVNYWQIGAVAGLPQGRIMPYTMLTVGATYWSFSNQTADFESLDSFTKFSFTAGLGAKTFFGENQRVGIRLQFRVLPTFYNTFATIGTGGVGVSGNAVWQWEIGGGIAIKLGG